MYVGLNLNICSKCISQIMIILLQNRRQNGRESLQELGGKRKDFATSMGIVTNWLIYLHVDDISHVPFIMSCQNPTEHGWLAANYPEPCRGKWASAYFKGFQTFCLFGQAYPIIYNKLHAKVKLY